MITRGIAGVRLGPASTASYGPISGGQGTAAEWVQGNPILPIMWIGYESDTRKLKIGDGVSDWNTLPYWHDVLPYASAYGNEIAWAQASMAQDTWYLISDSDMSDGEMLEATHDGSGKITVAVAGRYRVSFAVSAEMDAVNKHLQAGVSINGASPNKGLVHHEAALANVQFNVSNVGIYNLAAGDTIQVAVRTTDTGTPSVLVDHLNVTVEWVGV